MEDNKPTITAQNNGPLIVNNLKKFTNSKCEEIKTQDNMALCRCGKSESKPFCDGTHTKVNFSDNIERKKVYETEEFKGKDLTVVDNVGACSHAGFCVKGSPDVFFAHINGKRISHPDNETKEETIKTIKKCPSGSLAYKIDGKLYDEYFTEPEIHISKDGPLYIRGNIKFADANKSNSQSKEHYTLCRCGASKNKPFCDGNHAEIEFSDEKN